VQSTEECSSDSCGNSAPTPPPSESLEHLETNDSSIPPEKPPSYPPPSASVLLLDDVQVTAEKEAFQCPDSTKSGILRLFSSAEGNSAKKKVSFSGSTDTRHYEIDEEERVSLPCSLFFHVFVTNVSALLVFSSKGWGGSCVVFKSIFCKALCN